MGCFSSKPENASESVRQTTTNGTNGTNATNASTSVVSHAPTATPMASSASVTNDFQEVSLTKPGKAAVATVATRDVANEDVVHEMSAAVESVSAQVASASTSEDEARVKEIPKPKEGGMSKSKSAKKNERKRERAKQRKQEDKSTTTVLAPSLGTPGVSVARDLY